LNPNNPRAHNIKQIQKIPSITNSLDANIAVLADPGFRVTAGHGRLLPCKLLGIATVFVIHLQ
jgi:hypothetical protein